MKPSIPDEFETSSYVYKATIQDQLLRLIQDVLDYVQDPNSFIFGITEPIGNFLVKYGLEPLRVFLTETPWFITIAAFTAIAFLISGPRPGDHGRADAVRDRRHGRLGPRRWTPPRRCSWRR